MSAIETDGRSLLTHSRMSCAKTCLRKHYFAYELGIRKENQGTPLRFGSAFHLGLDLRAQGKDRDEVAASVRSQYAMLPPWVITPADEDEWFTECETVVALLCLYDWRWQSDGIEVIATEQVFDLPLVNPETNAASRNWRMGGKIDKIVKLPDGRLALMEHKTTSDSLDPDSDYWRRLRLDSQISLYVLAARELGFDVQTVLYDVIRKPAHRPSQIPLLDSDGLKIVEDAAGNRIFLANGKPRQAGDSKNGWTLKSRTETPDEFAQRVYKEMYNDFDRYFARQEIPRLDSDLDEFRWELWQQQQLLRECQRSHRWYRNSNACLHPYKCEYFDICSTGSDPSKDLPAGFVQIGQVHPELGV